MPQIEQTDQGEQYVLPGTERRTLPGLPYSTEPDGQLTLPFYAPPCEDERRTRSATPDGQTTSSGTDPAIPPAIRHTAPVSRSSNDGTKQAAGLFGRRLAHFPHAFDPA
ncbi:hypothetical protein [Azospirillum griseum]|uniref:Uncharacterized protein n=1 Tax=Azospirillum griseum TaxID=2496639 RepID=A0A431VBL9_9PROT|nr:hypothetical protein [Azospirillum griseum]RTR15925.1 hypothetical protein EJ903_21940 [Azospirillum griseum]